MKKYKLKQEAVGYLFIGYIKGQIYKDNSRMINDRTRVLKEVIDRYPNDWIEITPFKFGK